MSTARSAVTSVRMGLEPFERHFRRMVRAESNDRTLNQRPAERHEHSVANPQHRS